jgi:hypothetical protein
MIRTIYFIIILLTFSSGCNSQTKDSADNEICYQKIKELYGSDVDFSGPLSIRKVEKENLVSIEKEGKKETLPFGFLNDKWNEIKSKIIKGDKIFKFTTNPESWENLAGREGFIVLRGNMVIGTIITSMN